MKHDALAKRSSIVMKRERERHAEDECLCMLCARLTFAESRRKKKSLPWQEMQKQVSAMSTLRCPLSATAQIALVGLGAVVCACGLFASATAAALKEDIVPEHLPTAYRIKTRKHRTRRKTLRSHTAITTATAPLPQLKRTEVGFLQTCQVNGSKKNVSYINLGPQLGANDPRNLSFSLVLETRPRTVWMQQYVTRNNFILKTEVNGIVFSMQTGPPPGVEAVEPNMAFVAPVKNWLPLLMHPPAEQDEHKDHPSPLLPLSAPALAGGDQVEDGGAGAESVGVGGSAAATQVGGGDAVIFSRNGSSIVALVEAWPSGATFLTSRSRLFPTTSTASSPSSRPPAPNHVFWSQSPGHQLAKIKLEA